ncbi:uncharacterized protein LOC127594762 [Hippocampus zosterae]|uniref:uncharacterized protein LOC127594762 n=1 Tax=Hippocampus zosterae TaxID=109293 RepID=UPI00223C9007|nr:uncharacterized protein LOC127594762 [Hippocampus zosterae]
MSGESSLYNKENRRENAQSRDPNPKHLPRYDRPSLERKSVAPDYEILNEQLITENGQEKRIVSKAMWGESLRKATEAELYEQPPSPKEIVARGQPLPNYEDTKVAVRPTGSVTFFGASTNRGSERSYNEDRVSVILNIIKPESRKDETWPHCSFFGVYDGHGGTACADFLRDNLHQFVVRQKAFPFDPREAIRRGFLEAETAFLQLCEKNSEVSGSCAIVLMVIGQDCYIANVGDSRALLSCYGGESIVNLSRDHKPTDSKEQKRILEAQGKVFLTYCETLDDFGDIEAKLPRLGGNPRVLISMPEITSFRIDRGHETILLGCDGIFDCLRSEQVVRTYLQATGGSPEEMIKGGLEDVLRAAMNMGSQDNLTIVAVGLRPEPPAMMR